MMKWKVLAVLIGLLVLAGAGLAAWWSLDLRWRPHTITRHQAEIARLLQSSGWVSPGLHGPALYEIGFRSCEDCVRLRLVEFPKYHKAGVDTRVIMVARRDYNGLSKSTPAERSTVAELWANRRWSLLEAWEQAPPEAWTAPGVIPADGDMARTALVDQSRLLVDRLGRLLADNGVDRGGFRYPTLIWWDQAGRMRACACESPRTYAYVRKELGA